MGFPLRRGGVSTLHAPHVLTFERLRAYGLHVGVRNCGTSEVPCRRRWLWTLSWGLTAG
ncbi:hypothetical protein BDZ89DRAFT_1059994 [Hymenopellis radicata]|nr:hypothetical protein BDZ89DRAFT_1059994 [Hymenopellis radicata]